MDAVYTNITQNIAVLSGNTIHTGRNAVVGLCIAAAIVATLYTLVVLWRPLHRPLYLVALLTKVTPAVGFAPLFILTVGANSTAKALTAALICFFPMVSQVFESFIDIPQELLVFEKIHRPRAFVWVRFFVGGYHIAAFTRGMITAAPLAVVGSIVGDYIVGGTRPGGLGAYILAGANGMNTAMVVTGIIFAAVLGLIFFATATGLDRWLRRVLHLRTTT